MTSNSMNLDGALKKAARLLNLSDKEAPLKVRSLWDTGFYVWEPRREGRALIVGFDGSVLFANSSVSPATHEALFAAGQRTDERLFAKQDNGLAMNIGDGRIMLYQEVRFVNSDYASDGCPLGTMGYVIEIWPNGKVQVEVSDPATGVTIADVCVHKSDVEVVDKPS